MRTQTKEITNNFGITKNIPIDTRYWIESLAVLNNKIPLSLRYEGLMFFVSADVPDTDVFGQTGFLYMFEKDLHKPIKVSDMVLRYEVHGMDIRPESATTISYWKDGVAVVTTTLTQIKTLLTNESHARIGTIISIPRWEVSYIWNGIDWVFHSGEYRIIENLAFEFFNNIPSSLKRVGGVAWLDDCKQIINKTFTTDHEVTKLVGVQPTPIEEPATQYEDDRYFTINNILFHSIGGDGSNPIGGELERRLYRIGKKVLISDVNVDLPIGESKWVHNFATPIVKGFILLEDGLTLIELKTKSSDDFMSLLISSKLEVNGKIIMVSDF